MVLRFNILFYAFFTLLICSCENPDYNLLEEDFMLSYVPISENFESCDQLPFNTLISELENINGIVLKDFIINGRKIIARYNGQFGKDELIMELPYFVKNSTLQYKGALYGVLNKEDENKLELIYQEDVYFLVTDTDEKLEIIFCNVPSSFELNSEVYNYHVSGRLSIEK